MDWMDSHIMQVQYWLDFAANLLPVVLTLAVIFTFFLVHSFARQLARMSFYLDRIDNHLREITYFLREYKKSELPPGQEESKPESEKSD
ncbi:MAG: hypothetical protein JXQ83_14045 [Candidatus Glassbacteria bacterium]|nr:hypothetical protein [Candidatus Glassbacteria bacterium]